MSHRVVQECFPLPQTPHMEVKGMKYMESEQLKKDFGQILESKANPF